MENLRIVISVIAGIIFIFQWYALMGKKHTKFMLINHNKIWIISARVSLILSIICIVLSYLIYDKVDFFMLIISTINSIIILTTILGKIFIKNKKSPEIIKVKAGKYEIVSDLEIKSNDMHKVSNYMKINDENGEKFVIFNGVPPELEKNIVLYCMKTEEGYYICNTYMYEEKKKFTDILNIIFNYYIIVTLTYGGSLVTNNYLNNVKSDDSFQFIAIPIVFIIFRHGFKSTKFAKDSYTKFWHLVFGTFYILTLIEVLFLWFI